ncbi:MAG: DNA translocase FtsK, partial [Clostridiales bacterium]|nr:DNA translocase FtsK [Clostridiales bacterium]
MIFCGLFDTVATYIILIATMIISLTVITGKALLTHIAKKGNKAYHERKEYQRLAREEQLAYEAQFPQEATTRRPPKTFLFNSGKKSKMAKEEKQDKDSVIDINDVRNRKENKQNKDELPSLNLDHLFNKNEDKPLDEASIDITTDIDNEPLPTYKDELRSKFGNIEDDNENNSVDTNNMEHDTGVERSIGNDETAVESTQQTVGQQEQASTRSTRKKAGSTDVEKLEINQVAERKVYVFPPAKLLSAPKTKTNKSSIERSLKETAVKLQRTFDSFGVNVTITDVSCGPAVTRFELQPEQGVKVSKITSLADDIKLNLAAADIRIEAPIPGKAAVGIEVPNKENSMVSLREMIESQEFKNHPSDIAFTVGKDIGGKTVVTDIAKMPHLLIAGATGSGKSVCINTLIMSIIYKSNPSDVRMIMIDPKVVELSVYNGIPHLLIPVVTDPKKAAAALNWAVVEMMERYKKFADTGVRDLKGYNEKASTVEDLEDENYQKLPQIVIIIDELADLMMVAPGEVEDAICRLAQLARAAGIHLVIAT